MVIVLQRDFKHLVHKVWIGVKFEQGFNVAGQQPRLNRFAGYRRGLRGNP